jgi:bacterioferritin
MKGSEQVINVLNQVLRKELTGINQYFIHAKMCDSWGYERLYKVLWDESIGEMKHADQIIERILFLEGIPNISAYDKISVGTGVKEQLENDRDLEIAALTVLHPGIKTCGEAGDDGSRELLEHIVVDEEKHIDWIESQLHQINEVGIQNYLAQQINKD